MFQRVEYQDLNSRQQENYNFQKVAGRLADYGYNCLRLNDDWQGADFLAVHVNGKAVLRVQLKGRFVLDKKYCGKDIHIAFPLPDGWCVFPHDIVLQAVLARGDLSVTKSWAGRGTYTWPNVPRWADELLNEYRV